MISVIIATRDRLHRLPHAVASVLAQDHQAFEVIVVDDGSTDGTADWLQRVADPQVRSLRTNGVGLAAARNHGLAAATGEFVAYLDDDNTMLGGWLRAIAWAFDRFPDDHLGYGARVMEDEVHIGGSTIPGPTTNPYPSIQFDAFDRAALHEANYIDANVIAHRRDHPEAHFDERLGFLSDWDLAIRLSGDRDARPIPVLACAYSTREPTRMSLAPSAEEQDMSTMRTIHGIRPLDANAT